MSEIQNHFVLLCNELDVDAVLPHMLQARLLTPDEYEKLRPTAGTAAKMRREQLLLLLPRKGSIHFELFCKCLVQSGQGFLAQRIGWQAGQGAHYPHPPPIALPSASTAPPPVGSYPIGVAPSGPTNSKGLPSLTVKPHPLKILIIYSKETNFNTTPFQRSPEAYCNEVQTLADTLNIFAKSQGPVANFECVFDGYDTNDGGVVRNYFGWFNQQIKEADCILLLCSPLVHHSLEQSKVLQMSRGVCDSSSIVNAITNKCCIPVFLNMPQTPLTQSWIPINLQATTSYSLHISELVSAIGDTQGLPEHIFAERATNCFMTNPRLRDLASLLQILRREHNLPPQPIQIPIPPVGIAPSPRGYTASPAAFPGQVSQEIIMQIAPQVQNIWEHLGIKLGVPFTKLQSAKRSKSDLQQTVLSMLHMWQEEKGSLATRAALKQALIDLNYRRVAHTHFPND